MSESMTDAIRRAMTLVSSTPVGMLLCWISGGVGTIVAVKTFAPDAEKNEAVVLAVALFGTFTALGLMTLFVAFLIRER